MEAHIDVKTIIAIIGWLMLAVTGGIAWGRIKEKTDKHEKAVEDCHMEEFQKLETCEEKMAACPGKLRGEETFIKVERIEKDLQEVKNDLKASDKLFHKSQLSMGATVSRIETQLNNLIGKIS